MTKQEFVDQVADRAGLSKKDAAEAVDAFLDTVEDALKRGSDVSFSGFGKFSVSQRSAREGRKSGDRRADPDRSFARTEVHGWGGPEEGRQVARAGRWMLRSRLDAVTVASIDVTDRRSVIVRVQSRRRSKST